tara:strand:- start:938 stop:1165 length:228 start_codon:yes stop_codon:yes gene_type:complete
MIDRVGKTREDVNAENMIKCREIVKEIVKFGVNENQKQQIIKLLACELEDNQMMKNIVNIIKGDNSQVSKLIELD